MSASRGFNLPQPREIWWACGSVKFAVLNAAVSAGSVPLTGATRRQYEDLCSMVRTGQSRPPRLDEETHISYNGKRLKVRPCIVTGFTLDKPVRDGEVTGTVRAYVFATYGGTPITQLPELAQHFSVSIGDTRPWPAPDSAAIHPLPDWPKSRETPVYAIAHSINIPLSSMISRYVVKTTKGQMACRVNAAESVLLDDIMLEKKSVYRGKSLNDTLSWNESWEIYEAERKTLLSQISAARTGSAASKKKHKRAKSGASKLGANEPVNANNVAQKQDASRGHRQSQSVGGNPRSAAPSGPQAPPPPPAVAHPPPRRQLTIAPPPQATPPRMAQAPQPSPGLPAPGWQANWSIPPGMRIHSRYGCAVPLSPILVAPPPAQQYAQHGQLVGQQQYAMHPAHGQPAYAESPAMYKHPPQTFPAPGYMHAQGVAYAQSASAPTSPTAVAHFQQQQQQYYSPHAHSTFSDTNYAYAGHAQDAYDPGHNQYHHQQQQQQQQYQHQQQYQQHPSYSGVHEGQAQANAQYMQLRQQTAYNPGHNQYAQPQHQNQLYFPGMQMHDTGGQPFPAAQPRAPDFVGVAAS